MSMFVNLTQMDAHAVAVLKGPPQDHRLTFAAEGNDASDVIYDGTLCSLNAEGKLVKGVTGGTGTNLPMPLFSCTNSYDNGVRMLGYQTFGGQYMTLVATGGYEIETTEFVPGVYNPNDALVPATADNLGKVTKAADAVYEGSLPIVGIVSQGIRTDESGLEAVNRLAFWTVFIPAKADASSSL